jgi:hypothetical protein
MYHLSKLILFIVFANILSAHALREYYSAKINGKEYHLFIGSNGSYLYPLGSGQTYFLKKEILLGTVKKFEIFESNHREKSIGEIKITEKSLEAFHLENIKAKNVKLKPLKLPIKHMVLTKQIYNNDKCSFRYLDMNDVHDIYIFKELSFLISEVMDSFKEYNCDYLKSSRSSEMDPNLNQLSCENETIILKDRFYGINLICKGSFAKSDNFKYQVFSVIFDKTLKARVVKNDLTASDITAEDDYKNLEFRLTPVGLALYSTDAFENKEEYVRIIPYIDIKKHFSVWGKPKRFLNHLAVK